jgi:hypothetical protein
MGDLPLRLSAAWNSFATFCGIPTFLANFGLWAAACMVRACFFEVLGIVNSWSSAIAGAAGQRRRVMDRAPGRVLVAIRLTGLALTFLKLWFFHRRQSVQQPYEPRFDEPL